MEIIYEDKDILVINKPAGQLVQSGKNFDLDLVSQVLTYRKKKGEEVYAAVINRLDRPVSGLVLFAKNKAVAARLSREMQNQGFCKEYYALVCGKTEDEGTLEDYLIKDEKENVSRVADASMGLPKEAKLARLHFQTLRCITVKTAANDAEKVAEAGQTNQEEQTFSLVKIRLETGRHHQIRVQFSSRGHGIVGDVKYGGPELDDDLLDVLEEEIYGLRRKEIALCAAHLKVGEKDFSIKPKWMRV